MKTPCNGGRQNQPPVNKQVRKITCVPLHAWLSRVHYQYTHTACLAPPAAVENGMVVYSSGTTEPYDYGTTAVYECDTGYELTSGDSERTCTGNTVGEWSGSAPVCTGSLFLLQC